MPASKRVKIPAPVALAILLSLAIVAAMTINNNVYGKLSMFEAQMWILQKVQR